MSRLRVAIIAPPWLALPVKGYGGIELLIEGLVSGLRRQDVDIEIFGNGANKIRGIKTHSFYKTEQFQHIHRPYYESLPIIQAHLQFALNEIRRDGKFDVIHDHNTLIGPQFWALASQLPGVPPVLHTFHGPPFTPEGQKDPMGRPDNREQLRLFGDMGNMYMVAISESMNRTAPKQIASHMLPVVHNSIEPKLFPFVDHKKDYFISLARFNPDKGQHIAAEAAARLNKPLRMAGVIAGISSTKKLWTELANPLSVYRPHPEFRYFSDKILPYVLKHQKITYSGNLNGARKMKFISDSKALLFPIDWEEPFGMAVIEALACGTPVVAMNRGAMPEIIEHGVNGFLANNEKEFADYMLRVDEIDPHACRRSVEEKFSSNAMAVNYIERYKDIIKRTKK